MMKVELDKTSSGNPPMVTDSICGCRQGIIHGVSSIGYVEKTGKADVVVGLIMDFIIMDKSSMQK